MMIVQINAFKRYNSYKRVKLMHKTENKTLLTFQFLKQQNSFERTGVKQVKK